MTAIQMGKGTGNLLWCLASGFDHNHVRADSPGIAQGVKGRQAKAAIIRGITKNNIGDTKAPVCYLTGI